MLKTSLILVTIIALAYARDYDQVIYFYQFKQLFFLVFNQKKLYII